MISYDKLWETYGKHMGNIWETYGKHNSHTTVAIVILVMGNIWDTLW